MRFSPVLLAVLTVSAAFGLSRPVGAQTPDPVAIGAENTNVVGAVDQSVTAAAGRGAESHGSVETPLVPSQTTYGGMLPTAIQPEQFPPESYAQLPEPIIIPPSTEPASPPGSPPPGTQTPDTTSPGEIQFDITPPSGPQIEFESPTQPRPTTPSPTPPSGQPSPQPEVEEPRVLVSEVAVSGVEGDLQNVVYEAIQTEPGRTTTRSQLQEDINAIFATGFFSNVRAVPEDTPLGVRVTFVVQSNPVLQGVRIQGNQVLPQEVVDQAFADQYGEILNLQDFQTGIEALNTWYQDNGYVLAQVVGAPQVAEDGTVTLEVAEGVIEDIQVRFLNKDGEATDEEGNPIDGRTRDFIITREFESQSGDVFNRNQIQEDLQRAFGLGIFEDVRVSLNPGQDPRKVDVVVNVTERNTGSLGAGLGFSSASGLFGTVSYQEQNLGGNNQRLGAEFSLGEREFLFDVSFTDPWIAGDPYRTSYTVNGFNRRSISLIFDGGEEEVSLPNGDRPRVSRFGGGVSFSRPAGAGWRLSLGGQYQHVTLQDSDGETSPVDELGNDLSFSGSGEDDLFLVQFAAVRDRRNDPLAPTSGSLLRLSTDQSLPFGEGSILLNRLRASYSYYIPVDFTNFKEGPEALAFNIQAGTVLGDLPPYEAFSLGGTDSVRGYDSGELGSGRSFVQATVEYRFPIFAIVGGALFADIGTDLGTADDVPGSPAEIRDKPGSGFGVGVGVRIQSPLGPLRVDYAVNDDGESRIHFGIGERF
jgi:outer membrane protein insertion porin family